MVSIKAGAMSLWRSCLTCRHQEAQNPGWWWSPLGGALQVWARCTGPPEEDSWHEQRHKLQHRSCVWTSPSPAAVHRAGYLPTTRRPHPLKTHPCRRVYRSVTPLDSRSSSLQEWASYRIKDCVFRVCHRHQASSSSLQSCWCAWKQQSLQQMGSDYSAVRHRDDEDGRHFCLQKSACAHGTTWSALADNSSGNRICSFSKQFVSKCVFYN